MQIWNDNNFYPCLSFLSVVKLTTIIQVTHSEKNAQYGNRILHIADGVVKEDVAVLS